MVVHLGAVGVAAVDFEHHPVVPLHRGVEVVGLVELAVLHWREHEVDVVVAAVEVGALYVLRRRDVCQVVEVDFIHGVMLRLVQSQLVCHLVREEQGLAAGLGVAHCLCREHGGGEGDSHEYPSHFPYCLVCGQR